MKILLTKILFVSNDCMGVCELGPSFLMVFFIELIVLTEQVNRSNSN